MASFCFGRLTAQACGTRQSTVRSGSKHVRPRRDDSWLYSYVGAQVGDGRVSEDEGGGKRFSKKGEKGEGPGGMVGERRRRKKKKLSGSEEPHSKVGETATRGAAKAGSGANQSRAKRPKRETALGVSYGGLAYDGHHMVECHPYRVQPFRVFVVRMWRPSSDALPCHRASFSCVLPPLPNGSQSALATPPLLHS